MASKVKGSSHGSTTKDRNGLRGEARRIEVAADCGQSKLAAASTAPRLCNSSVTTDVESESRSATNSKC